MYVIVRTGEEPTDVIVYKGGVNFDEAVTSAKAKFPELLTLEGDDLEHFNDFGEYTDTLQCFSINICFIHE
jgi:hypothetical protein